jgi:hypothetical protein
MEKNTGFAVKTVARRSNPIPGSISGYEKNPAAIFTLLKPLLAIAALFKYIIDRNKEVDSI